MKLSSCGTGGARRRMRWHSREHRPLRCRGKYGEDLVFEAHGADGRTYVLRLSADDVAEVADRAPKQRNLDDKAVAVRER